jgi:hypothetical protein
MLSGRAIPFLLAKYPEEILEMPEYPPGLIQGLLGLISQQQLGVITGK